MQLDNGGRASLTVTGSSMVPMLHHRKDSVVLIPITGKQKKGQVILYRRDNGQYVLHRIIAVNKDGYVCCGDNQFVREAVSHDQLLAVVDQFTRKGKTYACDDPGYRAYTAVLVNMFFLRRPYIILRRYLGRLLKKIGVRR